jgi:glycosyltransferase involved in cell wall biosynthesis
MPDVSIIVPAYNRTDLLRETLVSCLVQTYQNYEVIVVDDGSEEDIAKAVELLCRDFDAPGVDFDALGVVRYIKQPHLGSNAARNRGLREALGELIQFVDSDDLLHPDKIKIQRQILLENPDLGMVFCFDEIFHDLPGDMQVLWNTPNSQSDLDMFLWDDPVFCVSSPLWRRGALERIGPWDERLLCWQDWEFHIRALCRGIQYTHVPIVLQYIRDHAQVRSTNVASLIDREQSKIEAALAVANELKRAALWNPRRGDALATFLLSIAVNLRESEALQLMEHAIDKALEYAASLRLRLSARLMSEVIQLAGKGDISHSFSMKLVDKLSHKPKRKLYWKTIASPMSSEIPSTLLQTVRKYSLTPKPLCNELSMQIRALLELLRQYRVS